MVKGLEFIDLVALLSFAKAGIGAVSTDLVIKCVLISILHSECSYMSQSTKELIKSSERRRK